MSGTLRLRTLRVEMQLRTLLVGLDVRSEEEISKFLRAQGVDVTAVGSADAAQRMDAEQVALFDAAVVDTEAGVECARRLKSQAPLAVIMLMESADEVGAAIGSELPIDDCMQKPAHARELLGRLQAAARRVREQGVPQRLSVADILVDVFARRAWVGGAPVSLTSVEFDVLVALLRSSGRVVRREELQIKASRAEGNVTSAALQGRSVDVHIAHLRKKIGDTRDGVRRIETVRGVGYVFSPGSAER